MWWYIYIYYYIFLNFCSTWENNRWHFVLTLKLTQFKLRISVWKLTVLICLPSKLLWDIFVLNICTHRVLSRPPEGFPPTLVICSLPYTNSHRLLPVTGQTLQLAWKDWLWNQHGRLSGEYTHRATLEPKWPHPMGSVPTWLPLKPIWPKFQDVQHLCCRRLKMAKY